MHPLAEAMEIWAEPEENDLIVKEKKRCEMCGEVITYGTPRVQYCLDCKELKFLEHNRNNKRLRRKRDADKRTP